MSGRIDRLDPLSPDPDLRRSQYRALAERVAVGKTSAALFESNVGRAGLPRLLVRPCPQYGRAGPFPRAEPLAGRQSERVRPAATPSGQVEFADLAATDYEPAPGSVVPLRHVPTRDGLLGGDGNLWIQTFWIGGRPDRRLWVARRLAFRAPAGEESGSSFERASAVVEAEWSVRVGRVVRARPSGTSAARAWSTGDGRTLSADSWFLLERDLAEATAEPVLVGPSGGPRRPGPSAVFGATGAGKTCLLADRAARVIDDGGVVVAIDLHGDLGPAIAGRLSAPGLARLAALDVDPPGLGVAALAGADDRAADHLVAAVKRLTPDGAEIYWGFRLERIFDVFVRLVLESGGSLLDLYDLLTDADRRDSARLATRRPELGRFLDELGPIVRRTPDFLWPAAARLSKVALVPALSGLLAPRDGGVDVERLLADGRSLVVRIPYSAVGTEAAGFAGSLVLGRAYYGLLASKARRPPPRVLLVLDEVHGFSPRLVTEVLTEGRKFGVGVLLASQYPDRLAPELRAAVAGTVREVIAFRTPSASAAAVGGWVGLSPGLADATLPRLPTGTGVAREPISGELLAWSSPSGPEPDPEVWRGAVALSRAEFGGEESSGPADPAGEPSAEALLLAVLAAEENGRPLCRLDLESSVVPGRGTPTEAVAIDDEVEALLRRGWVAQDGEILRLTPAGERRLGLRIPTGAASESAEHRALLVRTFRLFARHGYRLEIVRQGRFDTTLPDGLFRQLPYPPPSSPKELAAELDRVRAGWAWRFFGGRDVHVEAEVSGALRPERIRRGVTKARRRGAFPLFVVSDAGRARRVRRALRGLGLLPRDAQVWTVRLGAGRREESDLPGPEGGALRAPRRS